MTTDVNKVISQEIAAITARSALSRPVATQNSKEIEQLQQTTASGPSVDNKQPEDFYNAKDQGRGQKNNQEERKGSFPKTLTTNNVAEAVEAVGGFDLNLDDKIPLFDAIRSVAKYDMNIETIERDGEDVKPLNRFLS
ncbi:MAG: hypothetical protein AB7U85_00715 [Alphaproteobacteria bacterium]